MRIFVALCYLCNKDILRENAKQKKLADQIINEYDKLSLYLKADIIEYHQAMEPDIMVCLRDTPAKAKDKDGYFGKNFYIVLIKIIDRVLRQPRIIPLMRKSCPIPVYKQSALSKLHI